MKKVFKPVLIMLCSAAVAVLIFLVVSYVSVDRSAVFAGDEIYWNGDTYVLCSGDYSEGKTIAKTKDNWDINEVEEDRSHTFIVARQFLDQCLYVKKDYDIPEQGDISAVVWGGNYITDEAFCTMFSEIMKNRETDFEYKTDAIFALNDNQKMKTVYICYNGCPVATNFAGYMGKVNSQWVITTYISPDQKNADGSAKEYSVSCYVIPDGFIDVIENYLNENDEVLKSSFDE